MTDKTNKKLSIVQQCKLLSTSRSGYYYEHRSESKHNLEIRQVLENVYKRIFAFAK